MGSIAAFGQQSDKGLLSLFPDPKAAPGDRPRSRSSLLGQRAPRGLALQRPRFSKARSHFQYFGRNHANRQSGQGADDLSYGVYLSSVAIKAKSL
ncbi:hypothetical protein ABIB57_004261 [Devosia sp. UYZn731]